MTKQKFDDRLIKLLEKEVLKERWKKKVKLSGSVIKKRITKKGSIVFTLTTKKSEWEVVVPQHRKEEFKTAKTVNEDDIIKIIGDKQISGLIFCDRIKKLIKSDEKQMKFVI